MRARLIALSIIALVLVAGSQIGPGLRPVQASTADISTQILDEQSQRSPIVITLAHSSIFAPQGGIWDNLGKPHPPGTYWWQVNVMLKNGSQKPVKAVRLEWILYDATRRVMGTETVDYQRFTRANISEPQLPASPLGAGEGSEFLFQERQVNAEAFALGHYALMLVMDAWFADGTSWVYQFPK